MSEIFVNKAFIRDVFYSQKKNTFTFNQLLCIREVKVVYHLKKDSGKSDYKVSNGT